MPNPRHIDLMQGSIDQRVQKQAQPILVGPVFSMLPGLYDAVGLGCLAPDAQAASGPAMTVRAPLISVLMALSLTGGARASVSLGQAKSSSQAGRHRS